MTSVRLEDVSKTFVTREGFGLRSTGTAKALDNLNLEIEDGEIMSILGPSGCGKTTLLKVVAGLESPDEGKVYYDGKDISHVPAKDRGIGMVFQNYALYPHFKSRGNLAFYFWIRKRPEPEIDEKIRITSQILGVGFDKLLDRKPGKLSGGEQQRVAIGRCIIRNPTVFLLDEPLASLDAKLRVKTRSEIKRLLLRFHITTLYVTHDQIEAIAMGDRLAIMRNGRVETVGTFREIYDRPANRFIAGFLGIPQINFFRCWLEEGNLLRSKDISIDVPLEKLVGVRGDEDIALGVRPEYISLSHDVDKGGNVGEVEVIEVFPSDRAKIIYLKVGNSNCTVKTGDDFQVKKREKVRLLFDKEKILLYDNKTGELLG